MEPKEPLDLVRLVEEHSASVYRYAYRLTGSVPDAEDLTQQVFLIAHEKLGQLRDQASVRSWLFTVLRRCMLRARRRSAPLAASSIEMEMELIPEELTTEQVDRELLQQALDAIPDDFRLVLVMFYYEGCSYREIAEQLQMPIGTVMSRLSRAKGLLRRKLAGEVPVPVERSGPRAAGSNEAAS